MFQGNAPLTLISRLPLGGNSPASRGRRSLKCGLERLLRSELLESFNSGVFSTGLCTFYELEANVYALKAVHNRVDGSTSHARTYDVLVHLAFIQGQNKKISLFQIFHQHIIRFNRSNNCVQLVLLFVPCVA